MENEIHKLIFKKENENGRWICGNCGAKYGIKKPNPTYCMKCKVEWIEYEIEN